MKQPTKERKKSNKADKKITNNQSNTDISQLKLPERTDQISII